MFEKLSFEQFELFKESQGTPLVQSSRLWFVSHNPKDLQTILLKSLEYASLHKPISQLSPTSFLISTNHKKNASVVRTWCTFFNSKLSGVTTLEASVRPGWSVCSKSWKSCFGRVESLCLPDLPLPRAVAELWIVSKSEDVTWRCP